jgi:hypothetical protein
MIAGLAAWNGLAHEHGVIIFQADRKKQPVLSKCTKGHSFTVDWQPALPRPMLSKASTQFSGKRGAPKGRRSVCLKLSIGNFIAEEGAPAANCL